MPVSLVLPKSPQQPVFLPPGKDGEGWRGLQSAEDHTRDGYGDNRHRPCGLPLRPVS